MDYKKIYIKIEKRYVIAAVLLLLLFISRQIMMGHQIDSGRDMSTLINVSGRQRMLSQKIAKDALMVYENPNQNIIEYYLAELELSLELLEQSHYNLISGNEDVGIKGNNDEMAIRDLNEIEPFVKNIVESGYEILAIMKQGEYNQDQILEHIKTITLNERVFLEKMDKIVLHYDQDAEENILEIERLENIVFYIFIVLILFITLFIFIPATKTLKYAFVEINEKNENIAKIFKAMKGIMLLVNKNGDIINYNASALEIVTIGESEVLNRNIDEVVNWIDITIQDVICGIIAGQEFNSVEVKIEDENGQKLTFLVSITQGVYREEKVFLINAYDITTQKKAESLLKILAITDKLTELYNRHFLESIIPSEIEASTRYEYPISVAMLDIDDFKKINDQWGHPVGDIVLQELARIIRGNIRESDYAIRVGGEEFLILMPYTNLEGAHIVAEKLRKAIENNINPVVGRYTASFGVAERKMDETYLELYNRTDQALYKAKSSGKNCVIRGVVGGGAKISAFLEWQKKWDSGDEMIDAQHRELVDIVRNMMDHPLEYEDKGELTNGLDTLMNHIEEHFSYEENLLADARYIGLPKHEEIHTNLLKEAAVLKERLLKEEIDLQVLLEFLLHEVVIGHLLKEDTKFFSIIKR